jgi:UDP-N-acetylmuramoyl-tripeptide--D-alanyl-D-alanine ligase
MAVRSFTLEEIAAITGGRVARPAQGPIRGLCLDSRRASPGSLFAALKGQRADGHGFAAAAIRSGAAAVLAEREVELPEGAGLVLVPSVERALGAVARRIRSEFRGEVLGIVGSCGKTTTKDFAAAVLGRLGVVSATAGNRNNLLGLPETLMAADMQARFWVLEMGISHPSEMDALAPLGAPTGVLFTNIQPVHTEFFPSLEAIRDEKAKVLNQTARSGFALVNTSDPLLARMAIPEGLARLTYGTEPEAELWVEAAGTAGPEGTPFRLHAPQGSAEGFLPVPGLHNLINFAGACRAGCHYGLALEECAAAAASLKAAPHRGQARLLRDQVLLFDDSYNANPAAVVLALQTAAGWGRRVIGALGTMLELGASSIEHHRHVGARAAELGLAGLLSVGGKEAEAMAEAFAASGRPCLHVERWEDGAEWLDGQIRPGDGVLIKGSRGIGLDGLAAWLSGRRGVA